MLTSCVDHRGERSALRRRQCWLETFEPGLSSKPLTRFHALQSIPSRPALSFNPGRLKSGRGSSKQLARPFDLAPDESALKLNPVSSGIPRLGRTFALRRGYEAGEDTNELLNAIRAEFGAVYQERDSIERQQRER